MSILNDMAREVRILDWDIENRPLTYWVPDMPTAQITSIASMWVGDHDSLRIDYMLLPESTEDDERAMLGRFIQRYNEADMVTGHYIRRHDLPITNAMLYELGLPLMQSKLTCDTKLDMFKKADLPATQEFLLDTLKPTCELGIPLEKFHMSQTSWREANRLTPAGIELTKRRVLSDVHAHSHLREAMLDRGYLRAPSMWNPGGGFSEQTEGRHR
ncbi:MAG: hypothetical protein H0W36_00685 [Gemmatimonadetes bacterium]|nr:hypothetical protein [Gemmatimonadota bacterium]